MDNLKNRLENNRNYRAGGIYRFFKKKSWSIILVDRLALMISIGNERLPANAFRDTL